MGGRAGRYGRRHSSGNGWVGRAFSLEEYVAPHLASGSRSYESSRIGVHRSLGSSRRQQPAALSALIDTLRFEDQREQLDDIERSHTILRVAGFAQVRKSLNTNRITER